MHPLGGILAKWAGLRAPELKAPPLVEVRQMDAETGKFVFLFNHSEKAANVEFAEELPKAARNAQEVVVDAHDGKVDGRRFAVKGELPAGSVRIWRIDY